MLRRLRNPRIKAALKLSKGSALLQPVLLEEATQLRKEANRGQVAAKRQAVGQLPLQVFDCHTMAISLIITF